MTNKIFRPKSKKKQRIIIYVAILVIVLLLIFFIFVLPSFWNSQEQQVIGDTTKTTAAMSGIVSIHDDDEWDNHGSSDTSKQFSNQICDLTKYLFAAVFEAYPAGTSQSTFKSARN